MDVLNTSWQSFTGLIVEGKVTYTVLPPTSCQDDIKSGHLTITGPSVSNITANSALLTGSVSVAPIPPGCTYAARLVWGHPTVPFPNGAVEGLIPPSPLTLTDTALGLNASSDYRARIEVTKQCGGFAPTVCNGRPRVFRTSKPTCDLAITKTLSPNPLVSGQPATVTITVKNVSNAQCSPAPIPGAEVRDLKSAGLTFTAPPTPNTSAWLCSLNPSGDAGCVSPGGLWQVPGKFVTFTVKATVTAPPGSSVTNCATVSNGKDTNPSNDKSCVTVNVKKKFVGPKDSDG